jgi:hypothetical protein
VPVPHVDNHYRGFGWMNLLALNYECAVSRIAPLQIEFEAITWDFAFSGVDNR